MAGMGNSALALNSVRTNSAQLRGRPRRALRERSHCKGGRGWAIPAAGPNEAWARRNRRLSNQRGFQGSPSYGSQTQSPCNADAICNNNNLRGSDGGTPQAGSYLGRMARTKHFRCYFVDAINPSNISPRPVRGPIYLDQISRIRRISRIRSDQSDKLKIRRVRSDRIRSDQLRGPIRWISSP